MFHVKHLATSIENVSRETRTDC